MAVKLEELTIEQQNLRVQLKQLRSQNSLVLLVGSAASIWAPTNLPSGMGVVDELADCLVSELPEREQTFARSLIIRAAFEHILHHHPRPHLIEEYICTTFQGSAANPVHRILRELLETQQVKAIITTNYDDCIEQGSAIASLVLPEDQRGMSAPSSPLFKIHGCVSDPSSLVYSLHQEGQLPDWKLQVLNDLLADADLLVLGYSGMDFDICPELAHVGDRRGTVIWNCRMGRDGKPELSANAKRVLGARGGHPLVGDLRDVLAALTGTPLRADYAVAAPCVRQALYAPLTESQRRAWAIGLFNALGAPTYAGYLIDLGPDGVSDVAKARQAFHAGHYRQAELSYKRDARRQGNDPVAALQSSTRAVECQRCQGRWSQAWRGLEQLEKKLGALEGNQSLKGSLARHKVTVLRHYYQVSCFKPFRTVLPWLAVSIQHKAKRLLQEAYTVSIAEGDWHDIQMIRMWADRMHIPFAEIYDGSFQPPDSSSGFGQMGYIVAEMMAVRDKWSKDPKSISTDELLWAFEAAERIGSQPECWKLGLCLWRSGYRAKGLGLKIMQAFLGCEYSLRFRMFVILSVLFSRGTGF